MLADLLARYKMSADELRKQIKIEVIVVLCQIYTLQSFVQVVCDLCSSKDGTLLGPKRNGKADK